MQYVVSTITFLLLSIISEAQILYECKSQTNDTVVYVLGTCHALPTEAKLDTVLLTNLMSASDVIFSEMFVDDGDTSYKRVISNLSNGLRYKNNGLLSDRVTKTEYAQIMKYYKTQYGTSAKDFRWSSYYLPHVMHDRLKYNRKKYYSLDNLLYSIAKRTNNKIKNLDNEQLINRAHAQLSYKYEVRWLLNLVGQANHGQTDDDLIIQHYLRQDTASIAGLLKTSNRDATYQTAVIDDRNKHWFSVIDQCLGKTNFVYCGLAHVIFGELSLLNFFRNKQFSIKAIKIDIKGINMLLP